MPGLPKRLKKRLSRTELEYLFRKGRKFRNPEFPITYLINQRSSCRFSVIISKKVNAKAVQRNKIRRRIYEILRKNEVIFPTGVDLAINIKTDLSKTSFQNTKEQLLKVLQQLFPTGTSKPSKT